VPGSAMTTRFRRLTRIFVQRIRNQRCSAPVPLIGSPTAQGCSVWAGSGGAAGRFVPFDELAAGRPTRWSLAASAPGAVRREGHRCWPVVTYVLVIQQVSSLSAGTFTRGLPASTERSGPQSTNRCAAPEPLTGNRSEVMDFAHHHTTRDAKIGANLSIGGCLTRNGRTGTPWQVARR